MNPEIARRYNAFWAKETPDRPIFHIEVSAKADDWKVWEPEDPKEKWGNLDARYDSFIAGLNRLKYFGEGYMRDWVNFGPGCMAAMIGSDYIFAPDTVWFGHNFKYFEELENVESIRLNEASDMYRMVMDYTAKVASTAVSRGYIAGITDLGGNMDILASLRNTEDLLMDLYDSPGEVTRAIEIIDDIWMDMYSRLHKIIRSSGQKGMSTWLGPWCEKRYYPLQCDFSAMISPDAFGEFVLPSLTRISEFLDHSIYHLDGPGELPHVDALLSMPRLDGIQWVPGDGNDPTWHERWFPLYEKVQAAGKSLVLHGAGNVEQILNICRHLSPKGLSLSSWFETAEEAEEVLAKSVEYSKR